MTFRDCIRRVMRATRLSTTYYAQRVTFRTAGGNEYRLPCHVRHSVRPETREDGSVALIDQIKVEIDLADLDAEPTYGDRILLDGDAVAYLYAHKGRHTLVSWKATFERRAEHAQGTRVQGSGNVRW